MSGTSCLLSAFVSADNGFSSIPVHIFLLEIVISFCDVFSDFLVLCANNGFSSIH